MRLEAIPVFEWPKLAWLAVLDDNSCAALVYHGPLVETSKDWVVCCVWSGKFSEGNFDEVELVFGTGVRRRGSNLVFVNSGAGQERLWYCNHEGKRYISNSLPAIMAFSGLSLRPDYPRYRDDILSVERKGLESYVRAIPTDSSDVHVVYFRNLVYDGRNLREVDKPERTPSFPDYVSYSTFLKGNADSIGRNAQSPHRRHRVHQLSTISSGYDSPAAAVIAKHAGCNDTATIRNSRSLWRGDDSGAAVSRRLGMNCREYEHRPERYRNEVTVWAAAGRGGGLNMTMFDYPEPLCLFFTGIFGDFLWDPQHELRMVVDTDMLLGEFCLFSGLFHCVVPWWGIRRARQIHALGSAPEMNPWKLQNGYDRPVPRRIVEETGVPRQFFGMVKRNTSSIREFPWPFGLDAQASFREYLRACGLGAPGPHTAALLRSAARWEELLFKNMFKPLGLRVRWRPWRRMAASNLLFQWANEELKKKYLDGLRNESRT